MKKVLLFGIYDPMYSRNRVLIKGFRENGFQVVQCRVDPKLMKGFSKYVYLFKEYQKIKKDMYEYKIVAFPGHGVVWLAYLLWGRDFILDAFVSLFDSNVSDRKKYRPFSLRGFKDFFLDWYSVHLARVVLLDTDAQRNYFKKMFGLNLSKSIRVLVGSDDSVFFPRADDETDSGARADDTRTPKVFTVHFHGSFIPLQGIEYIVEAADLLREEPIHFNFIGSGQEYPKIRALVKEQALEDMITFIGNQPYEKLPLVMSEADLCLGIFGRTEKTQRVIPNKVFEAVALRKPVITADTSAIREIFTDDELLMCKVADGKSLATSIQSVMRDRGAAVRRADKAYALFTQQCTPRSIVAQLLTLL